MKTIRLISALALTALLMCSCGGKKQQIIIDLPREATPPAIQAAVDAILAGDEADPSVTFESLMVLKHGNVIFEDWYGEAAPDIPHAMHSVSKSFTATAIGMLVDQGKISVNDKLVDFFPEDCPEEMSDNLKAITVHNLLTMNCGHETEVNRRGADNWVKAFLAKKIMT